MFVQIPRSIQIPPEASVVSTRERPPNERRSFTREFRLGDAENPESKITIKVTVGLFDDGRPCEIFINCGSRGSTLSGAFDSAAIAASLALQYGMPIHVLAEKWRAQGFAPSGFTGDKQYPSCSSVMDLIGRWLLDRFPAPTS